MKAIELHLPILLVLIPLFAAFLSAFCRRSAAAWFFAVVGAWGAAVVGWWLLAKAIEVGQPIWYQIGGWPIPIGIAYRVDTLNAFVAAFVTTVGAVIMPYAKRSVDAEIEDHAQAWFYTMYLLCLGGLLGMTVTADAFNVFVFMEISSLSTYVLIAMGRDRRALLASYQYLIVGTIGATFYVIGVGFLYVVTGSLNLYDIADRLATAPPEFYRPILAGLGFLTIGICLKLALFPLHFWLPNAYAYAPSVATAFLAGTATKVAVYLLIRIFFSIFGVAFTLTTLPVPEILLIFSIAAMVIASLSAAFETNTKRMLAYSSVAQIGYITLGIALANQSGLTAAIVHLFNHAIIKTALFLALGAVMYRTGAFDIAGMAGVGRRMPLTMAAFVVAGLGIIGVPGTAGFISKWYLAVGSLEKGYWPLVFLILASSLIAVVYIGRVVEAAYFREPAGKTVNACEAPLSMLVPLLLLGVATIWFGIDTRLSAEIASGVAQTLLGGLK
jgi:multicomponent Na+:H+ antiporter subunit D